MKRRHSGHMGGMNGQNRRGGQGGGKYNPNFQQRPRKNYPAMREKYMNQARDAMSAGDRVLAEYYMQHAEHCFRMHQEQQAERAARYAQQEQTQQEFHSEDATPEADNHEVEDEVNLSNSGLPAFITGGGQHKRSENEAPPAQNWEEE